MNLQEILTYQVGGNSIRTILESIGLFLLLVIIFTQVASRLIERFKKFAKKTINIFDDKLALILEQLHGPLSYVISFYLAIRILTLPPTINKVIEAGFLIIFIYYIIRSLIILADYGLDHFFRKETESTRKTIQGGLHLILNLILWGIGLLLILSNLGFNITSLVASLGIGGIAVALAAQHILSDLFSSFMIYFDKPFEVGDYIVIGNNSGTVQNIGLKTTRLLALKGNELIIPNSDIVSKHIHNYKKMRKRRISFNVGLAYETTPAKLKRAKKIITDILNKSEHAELYNVSLKSFGDFSLIYEIIYYVTDRDYQQYLDTQEEINLAIITQFHKAKISLAYPTQTLYLKK